MGITKHIQITQGSRFSLRWRLKDTAGAFFNLSAWTWRGKIRRTHGGNEVATLQFAASDYTAPDATVHEGATVEAFLLPSVTAALDAGEYVYDIEYDPPAGANYTDKLWIGTATIGPEVTR